MRQTILFPILHPRLLVVAEDQAFAVLNQFQ